MVLSTFYENAQFYYRDPISFAVISLICNRKEDYEWPLWVESGHLACSFAKVRYRPKADTNAVVMGLGELAAFLEKKGDGLPNSQPC